MEELKKIKKVILVCASCKKIRNESGFWESKVMPVDSAMEVVLSHGLCPDCVRELYPEVADKVLERNGCKQSAEIGG